jgi:hypothetical protein
MHDSGAEGVPQDRLRIHLPRDTRRSRFDHGCDQELRIRWYAHVQALYVCVYTHVYVHTCRHCMYVCTHMCMYILDLELAANTRCDAAVHWPVTHACIGMIVSGGPVMFPCCAHV